MFRIADNIFINYLFMKSKNNNKQNKIPSNKKQVVFNTNIQSKYYFPLFAILILTVIIYRPVFFNSFVWDDGPYVQNNLNVQSFNLKNILFNFEMGNYHPLTMLAFAAEHYFFGLNETGFHAVNLFLHLLNIVLVFYVVFLLIGNPAIAILVSLLFGIHPLHVESVAWISELKDLLYTFFFLGSYIFYIRYIQFSKNKFYILSLILFLASTLSKAMAVCLPVVFFLTDYFKGRKINSKTILEKLPFLLISFSMGILAIFAQKSSGSIQDITNYSFFERVIFAGYGFMSYLIKSIVPVNLSAYYPYPIKSGETIPTIYFIYFLLFIGLVAGVVYSIRYTKKIFFGITFFAITVFLVLQLLPVGGAIMADRYSYVPLIGIFYLMAEGINSLFKKKLIFPAVILIGIFVIFFSIKTYERNLTWKNGLSLWSDVISKYQTVPVAYNNRGIDLVKINNNKEALIDFNKALELRPGYVSALTNRGHLFMDERNFDMALKDYNLAVKLQPNDAEIFLNRGNLFQNMQKFDEALSDYNMSIKLFPSSSQAFYGRGLLMMQNKKTDLAYTDFSESIRLFPSFTEAYINRGIALQEMNRFEDAILDFNKAIKLNPADPKAYFNRANVFAALKRYAEAIIDFSKAIELKNDYGLAYFSRGIAIINSGKRDAGCNDLKLAINFGFSPAIEAMNQLCR